MKYDVPMRSIYIPKITPSLNEVLRRHWSINYAEKRSWIGWITVLVGVPACQYRRIIITRVATRDLDPDNLAGGCKSLLDAIRDVGLILDDDAKSVSVEYRQRRPRDGEETGTELEFFA